MIERFELMLHALLGNPMPPLPLLPGRVHRLVVDGDIDDFYAPTVAELVERFGITRQGAFLRLQRFEQTRDRAALLKPKASNHRSTAAPAGAGADQPAGMESHE